MTITITSTTEKFAVPGPAVGRVWEGATDEGVKVFVFVLAVGVPDDGADMSGFDAELVPMQVEILRPLDPERN